MGVTRLLVTRLGVLQVGGDVLQVVDAGVEIKPQRGDQGIGTVANLA